MADPFDGPLSKTVHDAISRSGVLEGEHVKAHSAGTVICIGMIHNVALHSTVRAVGIHAKNLFVWLGQKGRSSQPAPNPSFTDPFPLLLPFPSSTCPPCRNANSSAKLKSLTPLFA